jgi:hypothetical protein
MLRGEAADRTEREIGRQYTTGGSLVRFPRHYRRALWQTGLVTALIGFAWTASRTTLHAHEIPADVTVHVFVKPEAQRLRLLVRAPLEAMRDVIFPTREPGFLILANAEPAIKAAAETWIVNGVRVYENGNPLGRATMRAVRLSLPSDRSFESWDQALAHVTGAALPVETELLFTQAQLDVLLEFDARSETSAFSIETDFARFGLRTLSVIRFLPPGGDTRVFQFLGDAGRLHLDPTWSQAVLRFVASGIEHILGGIDHLLFVLCLVIPYRRFGQLLIMVTAFTVAHSITLIAAAFDFVPGGLWFPPLVETLIAASIVWMALENIVGVTATRHRWVLTFLFGLVHGFGFSFALRDTLQFGGSHFLTSLVAFNVGVELGQILALLVIVPALFLLFRYVVAERIGAIVISALVAHQAWHWMMGRGADLVAHDWPFTGWQTVSFVLRTAIVIWIAGWAYWYLKRRRRTSGQMEK